MELSIDTIVIAFIAGVFVLILISGIKKGKGRQKDRWAQFDYSDPVLGESLQKMAEDVASGRGFEMTVEDLVVQVPPTAKVSVDYENEHGKEELEIKFKWRP